MGVQNLGEALPELKQLLRGGADVAQSVRYVCEKHVVEESALRLWFERNTEKTPEEYREVKRHIVTIDGAIANAARRWVRNPYGPNLVGRRFHVDLDDRTTPGKLVRRWYRYIGDKGHAIEAIDEETLQQISFDGDPEFRREIRQAVKKARPYELANRLLLSNADEDLTARKSVLSSIRFVLWATNSHVEVDERIKRAPTLTHLYRSLTHEQRAELAYQINNPTVRVSVVENGRRIDPLLEQNTEILRRLQDDDDVPSPIHQG